MVTVNLNKIIDRNYYPVPEAKKSNLRHRPIGLGVQGLADAFIMVRRGWQGLHAGDPRSGLTPARAQRDGVACGQMRFPYESDEARQLNRDIFETIYFAAMTASCEMAMKDGPYETYAGSPVSQGTHAGARGSTHGPGVTSAHAACRVPPSACAWRRAGIFQFDMWNVSPSSRWDWAGLKEKVRQHGVRNSLLVAPMPTASTAQILGNNESFEPYTSNIYSRYARRAAQKR